MGAINYDDLLVMDFSNSILVKIMRRFQMMAYILLNSVAVLYSSQMMIMGFISIAPKFECNIQQPEEGPQWVSTSIALNFECNIQ